MLYRIAATASKSTSLIDIRNLSRRKLLANFLLKVSRIIDFYRQNPLRREFRKKTDKKYYD
jgi:hypothetical protein